MNLDNRIEILASLGKDFSALCNGSEVDGFPGFEKIKIFNPWFTEENVKFCLSQWSKQLDEHNLKQFCNNYDLSSIKSDISLAIIMAGNIPLVGFHDFLSGFICGIKLRLKISSKDNVLMKWVIDRIIQKSQEPKDSIFYTEDKISDFNAVIATGSDNTNRYFEYYFGNYPKILRHNRNSIAVLCGDETSQDLEKLADDVFIYFGLGCRSISKLYLPENYDFNKLGNAFQKYADIINHNKYNNNFSYQYSIIGMNRIEHVNFGNILLVEKEDLPSPIGVLNFEYYSDINKLNSKLKTKTEDIQCIVSNAPAIENKINFGETQKPELHNFADNIDTIKFIIDLCKK